MWVTARACLRHFAYLARHKWAVGVACGQQGLLWRGMTHDWSKLRPSEFLPYTRHFFGDHADPAGFERAWLCHVHRNDHHWQHWCLPRGDGTVHVLEMPVGACEEMLADWIGAHRAKRTPGTVLDWYRRHREEIVLAPGTRAYVEWALGFRPRHGRGRTRR